MVDRTTGRPVRFFLDRFCRAVGPGAGMDNAPPGSVQQSCRLWLSLRNLHPGRTYALRLSLDGSTPLFLPLENGRALPEDECSPTSGAEEPLKPVEQDGLWGYEDVAGGMRLPGRFVAARPFNPFGLAAVLDPDKGWHYVDRQGKEVIRPHVLDNGPDPFVEGLARFWEGRTMGFFDPRGQVVIQPAWDFARPFHEGRSAVCRRCRLFPDGEYTAVRGGRWGFIDPFGREVVPLRFQRVGDYENGRGWVEDRGRRRVLDRQGEEGGVETYQTCLSEIEGMLPELARIIEAEYSPGTFSEAEARFIESGEDTRQWRLEGKSGIRISVLLERFEGDSLVTVLGTGEPFHRASDFLYARSLEEGGNPDTQKLPLKAAMADEDRPRLSVHLVDTPEGSRAVVALGTPSAAFSQGLLPQAVVGECSPPPASGEPIRPECFTANPVFEEVLHETIARKAPDLASFQAQARSQVTGRLYVIDGRTPDQEGQPPPEDILGTFEVREGRLVTASPFPLTWTARPAAHRPKPEAPWSTRSTGAACPLNFERSKTNPSSSGYPSSLPGRTHEMSKSAETRRRRFQPRVRTLLILLVFLALLVLAYRSCTSGYDAYGYFVRVSDEAVFEARLSPSDPRIVERGRRLLEEIRAMDQNVDQGDGARFGLVRWYTCTGIDCDEGWAGSF